MGTPIDALKRLVAAFNERLQQSPQIDALKAEIETLKSHKDSEIEDLKAQLAAKDQALALAIADDQADEQALADAQQKLAERDELDKLILEVANNNGIPVDLPVINAPEPALSAAS